MPTGSCTCRQFTYEIPESAQATVICHCNSCQKFAGTNGSTNGIVVKDDYKQLSGDKPRQWTRKGDSGEDVTMNHCSNCNALMFVEIASMPAVTVFKTGTLDDKTLRDKMPVVQEVYTENRPDCVAAIPGAKQTKGMAD